MKAVDSFSLVAHCKVAVISTGGKRLVIGKCGSITVTSTTEKKTEDRKSVCISQCAAGEDEMREK